MWGRLGLGWAVLWVVLGLSLLVGSLAAWAVNGTVAWGVLGTAALICGLTSAVTIVPLLLAGRPTLWMLGVFGGMLVNMIVPLSLGLWLHWSGGLWQEKHLLLWIGIFFLVGLTAKTAVVVWLVSPPDFSEQRPQKPPRFDQASTQGDAAGAVWESSQAPEITPAKRSTL